MKIAMRIKISGGRGDNTEWPDPHVPFDVSDEEGRALCAAHMAYPVTTSDVETPEDTLAPDVEVRAGSPAGKPIVNSPKADWVAHAVSQGADPDEAAAMKKSELIAAYGNGA